MGCSKCGSENQEFRKGVSKKNGKPWSGLKCLDCDNMDFVRQNTSPKPPKPEFAPINPPKKPTTKEGIDPKVWLEKDAKIGALAFIKTLGEAGAYKGMDRKTMKEAVYDDYIFFKNREWPVEEKDDSPFEEQF